MNGRRMSVWSVGMVRVSVFSWMVFTCVCSGAGGGDRPTMCLNPLPNPDPLPLPDECYSLGDVLEVDVDMGVSPVGVCGGQFFLEYDHANLDFLEILPGDQVGGVTFTTILFNSVDEEQGTIDYAIGSSLLGCTPTVGPEIMARIRFQILNECETYGVRFRAHNPATGWGDTNGSFLIPEGHDPVTGDPVDPCETGSLSVNGSAPVINCPFENGEVFELNNDCGALQPIEFDLLQAMDSCDGLFAPDCTVTVFPACEDDGDCGAGGTCGGDVDGFCDNDLPLDFSSLLDGGSFPPGRTLIDCTTMNSCEVEATCNFEIRKFALTTLIVDIELSPTMAPGTVFDPITRCMHFLVSDCAEFGVPLGQGVLEDVIIGRPGLQGHGAAIVSIPVGNWKCLAVRDTLHTLATPCALECVDDYEVLNDEGELISLGSVYTATFKGSPVFAPTCHWLINGNLNGYSNIDIVDYTIFIAQNFSIVDPSTPCGGNPSPFDPGAAGFFHADLNGDGVVNIFDFSFIAINFLNGDANACNAVCDVGASGARETPRVAISLGELKRMGLGEAGLLADLNGDGWVNLDDVALYTEAESAPELYADLAEKVRGMGISVGKSKARQR